MSTTCIKKEIKTNSRCPMMINGSSKIIPTRWECRLVQALCKAIWRFLKELKAKLPCDSALPLLSMYLDKTVIQKDTDSSVFIAALFTIIKTWKQPECSLTDKWIKMWHAHTHMQTHTGRLPSHKKNEIMPFAATWMDLEIVILSE